MTTREPTGFVVDDDLAMRESLCWLISSVNLPVEAFSSAGEFLDVLHPDRAGYAVIDVRMPGMSGHELQEALAARFDNLASIIITGHADVQMSVRAMKCGALDFLESPQDIQQRYDSLSQRERQVLDDGGPPEQGNRGGSWLECQNR